MKKIMSFLLVFILAPVVVGAENISPEFQYEQEYNKYQQEIEKNQQLVAENQQMKEEYEKKLEEYQNQLNKYDQDSAEYDQKLKEYEQAKIEYQKKLDAYNESLKNLDDVINLAPGGIDTPIAKNLHLPANGSPVINVYDANDKLIASKMYDDINSTDYIKATLNVNDNTSIRVDYIYNQGDVKTDVSYHNTTISKISQTVTLDPSSLMTWGGITEPQKFYEIFVGPKFGFKFSPIIYDDINNVCFFLVGESAKQSTNPLSLDSIFDVKIQLYDTNNQLVNIEDGFPLQFVNDSFKHVTSTIYNHGQKVQRQTFGYIQATNTTFNPIKSSVIAQNNGIYYPTTTTNNNNNKAGFYLSSGTEYNYTYHEKIIDEESVLYCRGGTLGNYIGESSYVKDYLDYTPVEKPELPIEPRKPVFPTKPEEPKYHVIIDPIPPVRPETVSTGSDNLVITLASTIIIASAILLYRRTR